MLQRLGATIYFTGPEEWYDSTFDQYGTHKEIDDIIGVVDVIDAAPRPNRTPWRQSDALH